VAVTLERLRAIVAALGCSMAEVVAAAETKGAPRPIPDPEQDLLAFWRTVPHHRRDLRMRLLQAAAKG
jgi:hypothetical protein